jgi:hypothetical protein
MASLGDRCLTTDAGAGDAARDEDDEDDAGTPQLPAGTAGEVVLVYRTRTLMGRYWPHNCTAVWIENDEDEYVATLELTAGLRRPGLLYFQEHACVDQLGPDAITSATRRDHESPHEVRWSGVDALDRPVPDGSYTLYVEVTESDKDGPGALETFDVVKGPAPTSVELPVLADGALVQASLAWTPE